MNNIEKPKVVSRAEWLVAHRHHLEREKAFTRMRDTLRDARRELPWVKVDKPYGFDGPRGRQTLADLFEGRSQLIVKHFMFAPGWQEGCVGCSFEVDHIEGALVHLEHHDVSFVAIARAPLAEIEAFKQRMGWRFRWLSSFESDFNFDFHVSFTKQQIARGEVFYNFGMQPFQCEELSGISVFYKNKTGEVFHTFSSYGRGAEEILSSYMCLDLTPKGRNETGPNHNLTDWVRHHDRYDTDGFVDATGRYQARTAKPCCE